jgi:hypothetical protein
MGSLEVEQEVRRRTGGRSARVREAVLHATLDALSEHAPGAVTISEIARRAGVHATSIQRRWGCRTVACRVHSSVGECVLVGA